MTATSALFAKVRALAERTLSEIDRKGAAPTPPWRDVEDLPEAMEEGEQLHVLYGGPGWPCPVLGMVTMLGGELHWSVYLQDRDRFSGWEGPEPTLYCLQPELPEAAAAQG